MLRPVAAEPGTCTNIVMETKHTPNISAPGTRTRIPGFVSERLSAIREVCERYHVKSLYLYGSAVTDNYVPRVSDLDFMVDFIFPDVRLVYKGPNEHCPEDSPYNKPGSYYTINKRALKASLAEIFEPYLTVADRREPIDMGTYKGIHNRSFKREVDRTRQVLYGS